MRHQRSRTGPNIIQPTRWDTQTHRAEGAERPWKQKNRAFFFYSGRAAPAFLPASRAKSCLYRTFPTTTHAPSAWLALSHHGTAKPTATVHNQAGPAHSHTYPNTRLPTINHYSGGLMGLLFTDHPATMTQQATTTPPAPFFLTF